MLGLNKVKNSAFWLCLVLLLIAGGCSSGKHLEEGQSYLEDNSTKIKTKAKIKNKASLKSGLENQYRQTETRTFLGIPRHVFYYAGENNPKDRWFKRWLQNGIGDAPVILDTAKAEETVNAMELYLMQKGYWDGMVEFEIKSDATRSNVTYIADPGQRWTIESVEYIAEDSAIQKVVDAVKDQTLLEPGEPVDMELFERERSRLTRAIQNAGYAQFYAGLIGNPRADSSDHRMKLRIDILNPPEKDDHQRFTIGKIRVFPDFTNEDSIIIDTIIDGIHFLSPALPMLVEPYTLLRQIYLRPGGMYTRESYDKTLRQLNKLEIYSFVNIGADINSSDTTAMDFDIFLNRNKKMGIGGDLELNYSTLSQGRQSLIGLGADISYRNRNIFKGAEYYRVNLETGVEFNLRNPDTLINSVTISLQNNLLVPRFIDPFRIYRGLNKLRIGNNGVLSDKVFGWIRDDKSRINVGYQYFRLINLYSYHSSNVSLGYDALPDQQRRLQIDHMGIEFFSPRTEPAFDRILEGNQFLRESFTKQFFTGILFKSYRYEHNGRPDRNGFSRSIIHGAEISGLEIMAANLLGNLISGNSNAWTVGGTNPIDFAQFMKFDADFKFYQKLRGNQSLAFRFSTGLAFPYGPYSTQVPYVKQFYVGGPQSIRAWQIRELGPGGYDDPNVNENTVQFYQTGDVKLELSAEYRYRIGTILSNRIFLNGAFFVDAGNVWTLKEDPDRDNANITWNFYEQIAVGTGIGFRLDFKYFLIRLDLGYRLRNPYPDSDGDHWLWDNFSDFSLSQFNSNFAIDYPF